MDTRLIGEQRILIPDLDPRDLDPTVEPPDDDLVEALVDGAAWPGLELRGSRVRLSHLVGVDLTGATLRRTGMYGCRVERVDLSGALLADLAIERCVFAGCRLTGTRMSDVSLKNVIFEDCRLDYATFSKVRAAGATAVLNCALAHATFENCALPQTVVTGCDLDGVQLRECDLRGTDLRGNDLSGLLGITSLGGATVTEPQLAELAITFVREFALTVR